MRESGTQTFKPPEIKWARRPRGRLTTACHSALVNRSIRAASCLPVGVPVLGQTRVAEAAQSRAEIDPRARVRACRRDRS